MPKAQKPPNEDDIAEIIRNLCEISQEGWLSRPASA